MTAPGDGGDGDGRHGDGGRGPVLVIVNPRAGTGTTDALAVTRSMARATGRAVEVGVTREPGEATRLARLGVAEGVRHVIVVGGDGTLHEVVNGLVDADHGTALAPGIRLGVVGAGTGSDFARTFGLDRRPSVAARHALEGRPTPIDVGRVTFVDATGRTRVRAFVNIVSIGWTAAVLDRAARLPRRLRGARYVLAGLAAAPAMRLAPVVVELDHARREDAVCEVIVANGQFFGAGLRVAPRALPDDGLLDVQTWATGPRDVVRELPMIRVGEHLRRPEIRQWHSRVVRVAPVVGAMRVEADGEPLGTTPATIDLLRGLLDLAT